MKQELIEYHLKEAEICRLAEMASPKTEAFRTQLSFHERAVEWLELLPEYSKDYLEALKSVNEREPKCYSK